MLDKARRQRIPLEERKAETDQRRQRQRGVHEGTQEKGERLGF